MIEYKRILLVDDDPDFMISVKTVLESHGFYVRTALSENECLKILEDFRPDIAILDLMMEHDDSGFILAYHIKKKYKNVPVIIASAVTSVTGIDFKGGFGGDVNFKKADLIIDKGIEPEQILKEVIRLIK